MTLWSAYCSLRQFTGAGVDRRVFLCTMIVPTCVCRPLFALFLLLWLTPVYGQRTVKTEDYPDGKPQLYAEQLDGQADGLWLEWYPNGQLRYRARWKEGKGHGLWEYFYEDGQLRSRSVYDADQPIGDYLEYHPNGELASVATYVAGQRHGLAYTYDPTGTELTRQLWLLGERRIDRPEHFAPGSVSTDAGDEWDVTFSVTGGELYFTRRPVDRSSSQRIYRSTRAEDGTWTPARLATFSTATDEGAFLCDDGRRLYFASYRPLPDRAPLVDTDMNLWYVERRDSAWGEPIVLSSTINRVMQPADRWPYRYEAGPSVDAAGSLYYWSALEADGSADLLVATMTADGTFGEPSLLTALNTLGSESSPVVSPDGRLLCFAAYGRPDGFGQEDLYCARREEEGWGEALNLGPTINSNANEGCARFSPDGRYFYFCSDRGEGGQSDIFYLETEFLTLPE